MVLPIIDKTAIKSFIVRQAMQIGSDDEIFFIQAGFGISQSHFFTIYFDTRPDAGPDGSWTGSLGDEKLILKRNLWRFYFNEQRQANAIISIIRAAIIECNQEGTFNCLNLASDCDFCIEEFDGIAGWPNYEDRKKINLLKQNTKT